MTAANIGKAATGPVYPVLFSISTGHFINDTLQAVLLSLYPLLQGEYALSYFQIGAITMTFQVTGSLLQPLVGYYTDKHPLPFSLPFAPSFTLIGMTILAFAPSYPFLLLAAACIGIGSSIFHPEASRVTRLSSGGRYGLAQSLFQFGGNIGTSTGPLLAALIIIPQGQRSSIWMDGLAVLAIALLIYVSRWYSAHLTLMPSRKSLTASPYPRKQVILALTILIILIFSKFIYTSSLTSFYMLYLMQTFSIPIFDAQMYLFIYLTAFAVGSFIGGPIGDRIGRKAVIWFSVAGCLPFTLALPFANLFWTVVLTIPIGLILASAFSAILVYAQQLLPGRVGLLSGLFFGLNFGVAGIGAAMLGILADYTSISTVYHICAVLPVIGFLAAFLPDLKKPQGSAKA